MHRLICASVFVFFSAALSAQSGGEFSESANRQALAIQAKAAAERAAENAKLLDRSLKEKLNSVYFDLYRQAVSGGIKVEDARKAVDEINWNRERSGVWHLSTEYRDDGYFVVLQDFMTNRFDPAFNVSGYGLISATGELIDANLESLGRFSDDCIYRVTLGDQRKDYPCQQFVNGELDSAAVLDLKHMFNDHLDQLDKWNNNSR